MKNIIYIFIFISASVFAQKESNIWIFGDNAGLDFNSGTPVIYTGSAMYQSEGCSSISDSAGSLLFYTDGITVYNKNHITMTNGSGLFGDMSSSQSACIVKQPGNNNLYYIFTTGAWGGMQAYYSIVDMSLSSGLGDVTTKNAPLHSSTSEKLTAVSHGNNNDWWILVHETNSNSFISYLLDSAGVALTGINSSVGCVEDFNSAIGCMKGSEQGDKVAIAHRNDTVQVFDFDNLTGVLSNPITLTTFNTSSLYGYYAYGVAFSPNGQLLYVSEENYYDPRNLYQYNLNAGSQALIAASRVVIGTTVLSDSYGTLQLGPDHKLYVATSGSSTLRVINNPDILGSGCMYDSIGISLGVGICEMGLPQQFAHHIINPTVVAGFSAQDTSVCEGSCINFSNLSLNASSYSWSFPGGTPLTSNLINPPQVCYASPGNYDVTLVVQNGSTSDTLTLTNYINVVSMPQPSGLIRSGDTLFAPPGYVAWQWLYNGLPILNATDSIFVCLVDGAYSLTVTDSQGCIGTTHVIDIALDVYEIKSFENSSVYYDQNNKQLNIIVDSKANNKLKYSVFDSAGRLIISDNILVKSGLNHINITTYLSHGIYLVKLGSDTAEKIFKISAGE